MKAPRCLHTSTTSDWCATNFIVRFARRPHVNMNLELATFEEFAPWLVVFAVMFAIAVLVDLAWSAGRFRRWVDRRLVDLTAAVAAISLEDDTDAELDRELAEIREQLISLRGAVGASETHLSDSMRSVAEGTEALLVWSREASNQLAATREVKSALDDMAVRLEGWADDIAHEFDSFGLEVGTRRPRRRRRPRPVEVAGQRRRPRRRMVSAPAAPATIGSSPTGLTVRITIPSLITEAGEEVAASEVVVRDAVHLEIGDSLSERPARLFDDAAGSDRVVVIERDAEPALHGELSQATKIRIVDAAHIDVNSLEAASPSLFAATQARNDDMFPSETSDAAARDGEGVEPSEGSEVDDRG